MRSAFDLIRPVSREDYPNSTYQVFSGPGPFEVGQRWFCNKEDYKKQIQAYLRETGVTEYIVCPVSIRGDYGQIMTGYDFRFKNQEDHENLNVCFLGNKPGLNRTTLGLSDRLRDDIDAYVTALRQFMDVSGFDYQISMINPREASVDIEFSGDLAAHIVSRAHRTGYIAKNFLGIDMPEVQARQIVSSLGFDLRPR